MLSYTDNDDGTISDNITGLMWQKTADSNEDDEINAEDKMTQSEAQEYCENLTLAGYEDWRLPDIKTMYSLMNFSGEDISNYDGTDTTDLVPFINTAYFDFGYGDTSADERLIDAQWATTTNYVSMTMNDQETMFGVNFADGRIKGYGLVLNGSDKTFYVQCVRGNESYGENTLSDNGDGSINDSATQLMWQQYDNGEEVEWSDALSYCENLILADKSDWRLPNAKELQSIVDYENSLDTTNSAAIDTNYFYSTAITNEAGNYDFGFYWSSTTHKSYDGSGKSAVYVSFGRALGYMDGEWMDAHGAGAQRSDPKTLDQTFDSSYISVETYDGSTALTHGSQGDVIRGSNFVRCVRTVEE